MESEFQRVIDGKSRAEKNVDDLKDKIREMIRDQQ